MYNISISTDALKNILFNKIPTFISNLDKRIVLLGGLVFTTMSLLYLYGPSKQIKNSVQRKSKTKTPTKSSSISTTKSPTKPAEPSHETTKLKPEPESSKKSRSIDSQQLTELNNLYSSSTKESENKSVTLEDEEETPKTKMKEALLSLQKNFPFTVTKEQNKWKCFSQDIIDMQEQLLEVVKGKAKSINVSEDSLYGQVANATVQYAQIYSKVTPHHKVYQSVIDNLYKDNTADFETLDKIDRGKVRLGKNNKKEFNKLSLRLKKKEKEHIDVLKSEENIETCLKCPIEHYRSLSLIISDQLGDVISKGKKMAILGIIKELVSTEELQLKRIKSVIKVAKNNDFLGKLFTLQSQMSAMIEAGNAAERILPHQEEVVKEFKSIQSIVSEDPLLFAEVFKEELCVENEELSDL